MINWNEVTVGETELLSPVNEVWLVVCRHGGRVWLWSDGVHYTRAEESLDNWTIYDPWVDVSEECRWVKSPGSNYEWIIYHNGKAVEFDNPNFKSDGRRVWKRKEG